MTRIGIVGTTSWGTTLAIILARRGVEVRLLARTEQEANSLRSAGENRRFVPGVAFPATVSTTHSAAEALGDANLAILAVPSASFRANARNIAGYLGRGTVVISATKGLELHSGKRMTQVLEEELAEPLHAAFCALSGPNLAKEIVEGKPTTTVVASPNDDAARAVQSLMTSPTFRVYTNDDIVGVEFGGALKNIIALGAGICDGLQYGDNAKAAFLTRGLAEITRLGVAAGANPLTFAGLAGMGDLVATCFSNLSRNHHVGEQLAKGMTLAEIRSTMDNVAEGVDTTAAALELAERLNVEMPITQGMYNVLFNQLGIDQAVSDLLGRAPSPEWTGIDL